jgi:hypothetical protein
MGGNVPPVDNRRHNSTAERANKAKQARWTIRTVRISLQKKSIDFSNSPLRHRLLSALWDTDRGKPFDSRLITEVMCEVYPDDEAADAKLKNLYSQVAKALKRAGFPITVTAAAGKIWLAPL